MPTNNGKTAIYSTNPWFQENEAVEKDPIMAIKNFAINTTNRKPQKSPIETELKRDMRRLMFVCIMNFVLILACIIGFVVVASAQVKKVTSEDLITGKMERWIEVTVDSTTFPKKIMRFPMTEGFGYGTFPSIFKGSSNPVPFKIDTSFMQYPEIKVIETAVTLPQPRGRTITIDSSWLDDYPHKTNAIKDELHFVPYSKQKHK